MSSQRGFSLEHETTAFLLFLMCHHTKKKLFCKWPTSVAVLLGVVQLPFSAPCKPPFCSSSCADKNGVKKLKHTKEIKKRVCVCVRVCDVQTTLLTFVAEPIFC